MTHLFTIERVLIAGGIVIVLAVLVFGMGCEQYTESDEFMDSAEYENRTQFGDSDGGDGDDDADVADAPADDEPDDDRHSSEWIDVDNFGFTSDDVYVAKDGYLSGVIGPWSVDADAEVLIYEEDGYAEVQLSAESDSPGQAVLHFLFVDGGIHHSDVFPGESFEFLAADYEISPAFFVRVVTCAGVQSFNNGVCHIAESVFLEVLEPGGPNEVRFSYEVAVPGDVPGNEISVGEFTAPRF